MILSDYKEKGNETKNQFSCMKEFLDSRAEQRTALEIKSTPKEYYNKHRKLTVYFYLSNISCFQTGYLSPFSISREFFLISANPTRITQ